MADYSTTYAVDNVREYDVTAHVDGVIRIVVEENYNPTNPATADLLQRCSASGSTQIRVPMGVSAIYTKQGQGYAANEKAGTIQTSGGSITVRQIESSTV